MWESSSDSSPVSVTATLVPQFLHTQKTHKGKHMQHIVQVKILNMIVFYAEVAFKAGISVSPC